MKSIQKVAMSKVDYLGDNNRDDIDSKDDKSELNHFETNPENIRVIKIGDENFKIVGDE